MVTIENVRAAFTAYIKGEAGTKTIHERFLVPPTTFKQYLIRA
jgi:hypothetical protein